MTVYDLAAVVRSKNAGPFVLTIDLMFETRRDYTRVLSSAAFTPERIGALYGCDPRSVNIHPFERALAIKVSVPRAASSGEPADRDVYGSQQHCGVAELEIE